MTKPASFIERHGLWGDEQRLRAAEVLERVEAEQLPFVRLAWSDPFGYSRAKLLTREAFASALKSGHNINIATSTLDAAGARVFTSFVKGGGLGIEEMTGSPNLIVVPDPDTFRILPMDGGIGWLLGDEYFTNGKPFPFSPRQLLKKQIARLSTRGWRMTVGLEVEWYLLKLVNDVVAAEQIGAPGVRGKPPAVTPPEPGYTLHSESGLDRMQPMLLELAAAYEKIGLPLRSIENEWGPGQVECTFAPQDALTAADTLLLFRTATRQLARRMGYLASFMPLPAIKGFVTSGWHLHQSVSDARTGRNVLMGEASSADATGGPLSGEGLAWLGGLLRYAPSGAVFASPTVNGFRRYRPNSLAPDRATWAVDHRGALVRVLGEAGDPATRFENRAGEPSANPYLFVASQLAAGLAGVDSRIDPGPQTLEPYAADRPMLPKSLGAALDALENEPFWRETLGDAFVGYYAKVKRTELGRFESWLAERGIEAGAEPTEWEQNEYFDFF